MAALHNSCHRSGQVCSWCPQSALSHPLHWAVCQRCFKNWNRWDRLPFSDARNTKGKNESMSRGETWSNCSLPLSSWFPGITVVFLTFRGLTAGPTLLHAIAQWNFNTHSCISHALSSVDSLTCAQWVTGLNTITDKMTVVLVPCVSRALLKKLRRVPRSLSPPHLRSRRRRKGSRSDTSLPTSRFGLKQTGVQSWLLSVMGVQEHTHTTQTKNHCKQGILLPIQYCTLVLLVHSF